MKKYYLPVCLVCLGAFFAALGIYSGASNFIDSPPVFVSLNPSSETVAPIPDDYRDKVGHKHRFILVDPWESRNRPWWEWSHRHWLKDTQENTRSFSTEFSQGKITGAWTDNKSSSNSTLNKVCHEAFKRDPSEVETAEGSENKHRLARDLLAYCSALRTKPKTIKKEDYSEDTIGRTYGDRLADPDDSGDFWTIMSRYARDPRYRATDPWFRKIFRNRGYNSRWNQVERLCSSAYSRKINHNSTTGDEPNVQDVLRYCSFETFTH